MPAAAPLGVALTATYSAAAASIAGYQPGGGGPEEKMVTGIEAVEARAMEMAGKLGALIGQGETMQQYLAMYIASQRVS